ncbi:MAG: hypothetical protein U1E65_15045 [Myxococcota bacterium]
MRGSRENGEGWPCQRLRFAIGAILFFTFEITIGRQLPRSMMYVLLGMGIASMVSAIEAMRIYRHDLQLELVRRAMNPRRR